MNYNFNLKFILNTKNEEEKEEEKKTFKKYQ